MESKKKETYWSRFTNDFEEKQSFVVGKEIISLVKNEILKENNPGNVLELGCGTGLYTEALQSIADHVVATDLSDEISYLLCRKKEI